MQTDEQLAAKARQVVEMMEKRATTNWHHTPASQSYAPYTPNYEMPSAVPEKPFLFGAGHENFPGANQLRTFTNDWSIATPKAPSWMEPEKQMSFMDSLRVARRGLGNQLGNYARMVIPGTGHGGSTVTGNLLSDAVSTVTGHPPGWKSFGQSFTQPLARAMKGGPSGYGGLRQAWDQTAAPGDWMARNVPGLMHPVDSFRSLKNFILSPKVA